jgi:hypothetical protein
MPYYNAEGGVMPVDGDRSKRKNVWWISNLTKKRSGFLLRCQRFSATDEEIKSFVCEQGMEE